MKRRRIAIDPTRMGYERMQKRISTQVSDGISTKMKHVKAHHIDDSLDELFRKGKRK